MDALMQGQVSRLPCKPVYLDGASIGHASTWAAAVELLSDTERRAAGDQAVESRDGFYFTTAPERG
jgi:hypothetical protein